MSKQQSMHINKGGKDSKFNFYAQVLGRVDPLRRDEYAYSFVELLEEDAEGWFVVAGVAKIIFSIGKN